MREKALELLAAPETMEPLALSAARREGDDILEGELSAPSGARFPIRGGVPRFAATESLPDDQRATVEAFTYKWGKIPQYSFEEATRKNRERWYFERFGFSRGDADLRAWLGDARTVLEAGTGTGVDSDLLARNFDGTFVGIDISSTAIEEAFRRFRGRERMHVLQADIGRLPFKPGTFDVISCDQVLHHTPDPPGNFAKLARLLAPGGRFLLYVYSVKGPLREFADDHLRGLFTRGPVEDALAFSERITRFGRNLSKLGARVEIEDDLPELGIKKGSYDVQRLIYDHIVKCFWNDDYDFATNAMVNFDWYRPLHAFRYTEADVRGWAKDAGLSVERLDLSPSGISVRLART